MDHSFPCVYIYLGEERGGEGRGGVRSMCFCCLSASVATHYFIWTSLQLR